MRTLKKYVPQDDFDLPKQIDRTRLTAVLIRQSDHRAGEDHVFSRESQLKLVGYAMRLRGDSTDEHVRVYDEGAGVSGQKRIDERKELNRLYHDIKQGIVGSVVVMHEDRLFRDEYHTNDTTFINHLAKYDVLLFVRTDNRRYDCTKPSDRNNLLEKLIASRNYIDDHVLGRMNANQRSKALQGLFDGRSLPMGYVTQGKKKEQVIVVYEPWAKIVRWLFARFKELDSFSKLCHEIEAMPYLFPTPSADDLMRYTFKNKMRKVAGGFKPSCVESVKYMLTNPTYIGAWLYDNAIVREDNHPAIVDRNLFLWSYQKLTGRDLQGEPLDGALRRKLRDDGPQAVLKYLLRTPEGQMYVMRNEHPEYVRQNPISAHKDSGKLRRDLEFSIRCHLIDNIFLARLKEIAQADRHLGEHVESSIEELERQHTEAIVSIEDHLAATRLDIEKTLAFLHDQILELSPQEKEKYNAKLHGLREREQSLLAVETQTPHTNLQAELAELADVLADIPGTLDTVSMEKKQRLVRLVTQSVTLEEISVHWLRLTVVWRGPLADRPDVCLIWRQRGRRSDDWTAEEDAYILANYATADKWEMLEHLPRRSWNMIYQRALVLGAHRSLYYHDCIPENICVDDLTVFPDREVALGIVAEVSKRRRKTEFQASGVWLFSAGLEELAAEIEQQNALIGSSPIQFRSRSSAGRRGAGPASICW